MGVDRHCFETVICHLSRKNVLPSNNRLVFDNTWLLFENNRLVLGNRMLLFYKQIFMKISAEIFGGFRFF